MANPAVKWKTVAGKECIYFEFNGDLTETDSRNAVEQWKTSLAAKPGQKVPIVWNCLAMGKYDKSSRQVWQDALSDLHQQLGPIWVITKSVMITVGANVISTFTKFKINIASTEQEIKFPE